MKIYLSLPITGYKLEERIEYAKRQETILREIFGCEVFNPLFDVKPGASKSYEYYMGFDLWQLSLCDTIVFCPGWGSSKGCMTEYWFAYNQGEIKMLEMTDEGDIHYNKNIYTLDFDYSLGLSADL